jgi:2-polyprenyl-3-methyl-5-hydroxy-6-metoxy-1,4-benzoquinol methylase
MKNNFLIDLMIDPLTKEPLHFDESSDTLICSSSGNCYLLVEGIPRIIVNDNQSVRKSDLHKDHDTEFKYSDHYQKDADIFNYSEKEIPAVTREEFRRLRESILSEISENMHIVLDVGCGNGWAAKKLIPLGKKVISMDISTTNPVNSLKEVPHENHAGLIADVYNIPLKENSVDAIIASEILEHVPDPERFIINLVKLLKQNGKLIISIPYMEKIEYYLCVHCNKPTPKHAHLHSFTKESISRLVPQTGITWSVKIFCNKYLIQIRSHIFLRFFPYSIWKLFDNLFDSVFNKSTRLQVGIIKK